MPISFGKCLDGMLSLICVADSFLLCDVDLRQVGGTGGISTGCNSFAKCLCADSGAFAGSLRGMYADAKSVAYAAVGAESSAGYSQYLRKASCCRLPNV